jgi:hypothetical protein
MLKLKVVNPEIVGETPSDNVAEIEAPAAIVVFSLFQVKVIGPLAFDGVQLAVVKFKVIGAVPVFLRYIVLVAFVPGAIVAQLIVVQLFVQSESL